MQEQQKQLVERLQQAKNVLVTVSKNPTVDQLASAIGLTLALNHLDKHATAVFSGQIPSTIEFLKPEETLEKNTDSLRDFIIALDKSKADTLRYKVEDELVRIFITPYRTSLSERDLEFSQGDFNVEVVVALGVQAQQDLDEAITAHGRILHDATVVSITTEPGSELGTINLYDAEASGLSETVVRLIDALDKQVLDNQMATALLTGIVASTERFRNEKTTPQTMSVSAELMAAGANQQLVASQLESSFEATAVQEKSNSQEEPSVEPDVEADPGTLQIEHEFVDENGQLKNSQAPDETLAESEDQIEESVFDPVFSPDQPADEKAVGAHPQVLVDESGQLITTQPEPAKEYPEISASRAVGEGLPTEQAPSLRTEKKIIEPPKTAYDDFSPSEKPARADTITANTQPEALDPPTEDLTKPSNETPFLGHAQPLFAAPGHESERLQPPEYRNADDPAAGPAQAQVIEPSFKLPDPPLPPVPIVPQPTPEIIAPNETLADIEKAVDSPHLDTQSDTVDEPEVDLNSARDAVQAAFGSASQSEAQEPLAVLGTQQFDTGQTIPPAPSEPFVPPTQLPNMNFSEPTPGDTPADATLDMPLPSFGGPQTAQPNPLFAAPAPVTNAQPPVSTFPGSPVAPQNQANAGAPPPPPVPPPMLPPLQ